MLYSADFETTTDENDCRVWAWGLCEVGNPESFVYDNNIDSLFRHFEKSENSTYYFHNLKFDSDWLFIYLFKNGFRHVKDKKEEATKTFTTLISGGGLFYSIKIIFEKKNKKTKFVKIYDSLKILPFKVEEIAHAFGLQYEKLKLDYETYRPVGHILTPHEVDYLKGDCVIVSQALNVLFSQGLDRITQGSNALYDFKNTIHKDIFKYWFPEPKVRDDTYIRQAYKGGYTYAAKLYKERELGCGFTADVNSLYPWAMRECLLPHGHGIPFKGKYEANDDYPLYVQMIKCHFEVKENHIPIIQIKKSLDFIPNMYLENSGDDEPPVLTLTNVDLELFFNHYDVDEDELEYIGGYMFRGQKGMFSDYIDKWMEIKKESSKNGNKGMRTLSKLMMNGLYGKFAVAHEVSSKIPYMEDETIHFSKGPIDNRKLLYIPVAAFITAYARKKTIETAQKLYKYFAYADTDSVHLIFPLPDEIMKMPQKQFENLTLKELQDYGVDLPDDFEVDPVDLGAWKLENKFYRAKYLRAKCYIEDMNPPETWDKPHYSKKEIEEYCEENNISLEEELAKYEGWYNHDDLKVTCAGMPANCHKHVTWENFKIGAIYPDKLKPVHVKGGTVLKKIDFTIRP